MGPSGPTVLCCSTCNLHLALIVASLDSLLSNFRLLGRWPCLLSQIIVNLLQESDK